MRVYSTSSWLRQSRDMAVAVQGESLPLRGTVGQLMDKLAAAGVGHRPTIYICHRCYSHALRNAFQVSAKMFICSACPVDLLSLALTGSKTATHFLQVIS